jgi:hypothetical protein
VHKCSLLVAIGRRTLDYKRRLSIPENSHSPERFVPAMTCLLLYFSLNIASASFAVNRTSLASTVANDVPPAACATSRYLSHLHTAGGFAPGREPRRL